MNADKANSRIQTTCLIILATVAVGFAVRWLKDALIPFVVAMFLTIGLMPCVGFLMRRCRVPKIPAVLGTLIIAVVVLAFLAITISSSLSGVTTYADTANERMQGLLNWVADSLPLETLNIEREQVLQPFSQVSGKAIGNLVVNIGSAMTSLISDGVLVLIFLGFLMFAGPSQTKAGDQWEEIETNVRQYIVTKVLISAATGILTTVILWSLNVDLAILLGLLAFLLNFIPSIGSCLGVIVPLPIILMDKDSGFGKVLLAVALLGAMQFVIGNVIEPRLMGKRFGLHPVVILLALVFWGTLWGIIGMFLAVPMTAVIKIVLEKHERSRGVAELLSGDFRGEL